MAVSVAGVQGREMPGLKAALKTHRSAWIENGDAVLNLIDGANGAKNSQGEPLTENDPRPAYQHAEYPLAMYHARLEDIEVGDEMKELEATEKGYRRQPYVVVKITAANPDIEKANLKRELDEKQGQIATLADQLRSTNDQMAEMKQQMAEMLSAVNANNKLKKTA